MSKRSCSICAHLDVAAINSALFSGVFKKSIAQQFGVSPHAISRHSRNCLVVPAPAPESSDGALEVQAARWLRRADDIYAASTANGDVRGQVQSLTAAFRGLELQHRAEQREAAATPEPDREQLSLQDIDRIAKAWDNAQVETANRTSALAMTEARRLRCNDLYEVFVKTWDQPSLRQRLLDFCNEELFAESTEHDELVSQIPN